MIRKHAIRNFTSCIVLFGLLGFSFASIAQTPLISVRFANPQNDCATQEYCLDVEFKSDIPDQSVFGMNVRFFYDEDILELVDFRDFQGGYGPVAPNPPIILTSIPAGPALFNFEGAAEFINGAIQLVNSGPPPIVLDTMEWTKIFQVCFTVDDLEANLDTFCPPVVWDLEQDPANGGFLAGDDGIVITVVDPDPNNESLPANEMAVQFNWEYIGAGMPPFGQPIDSICSNINCALPIAFLSFKGEPSEAGNLLDWKTTQEINVEGYFIQQSVDRLTWRNIGFVGAKGQGAAIMHYQYIDTYPVIGINYYRLQQLDEDGRTWYSNLVRINNTRLLSGQQLTVYPNPARDGSLSIYMSGVPEPGATIQLIDPTGQLVREEPFTHSGMKLDISALSSGIYIVWVGAGNGSTVTKVFIE